MNIAANKIGTWFYALVMNASAVWGDPPALPERTLKLTGDLLLLPVTLTYSNKQ